MKRNLKSYFAGWLALCLAAVCLPLLPAGCAGDGAAPRPADGETTSVTLRMSVAGAAGTRAAGTEDEYTTLEERINTLRVLVVTDGNTIAVNHKLTAEELTAPTVTIDNVPVGRVTFCVLANEAALGKDYDTEEFKLVNVPDRTSKKALLEDPGRKHFPKRFSEVDPATGLPMSWIAREVEVTAGQPITLEAQLVRCVAKLNISMNNELDSEIKIKAVNFGAFFGDRLYLFGEQSLDVPDGTVYADNSYTYETEEDYIKIPAYDQKMLVCYIYPSYAWKSTAENSPYTIGFATVAKGTYPQRTFIAGGALNSIARNTQVNIGATLSVDTSLTLSYEVVPWGDEKITVPPFN